MGRARAPRVDWEDAGTARKPDGLRLKTEGGSAVRLIRRVLPRAETGDVKPIRILLVDDQGTVRRGLRMRLALEPDFEVVGEAEDGAAAIKMVEALAPNVVLMDVEMPELDGIAATERIASEAPACCVIILSLHDDPVTRLRAEKAGAASFVAKHRIDGALVDAIRASAGDGG